MAEREREGERERGDREGVGGETYGEMGVAERERETEREGETYREMEWQRRWRGREGEGG